MAYKEPDEFIQVLEDLPVPQEKKGAFFLEIGIVLYNFSYFRLALNSWDHSLKYFLKNKDKSGESTCYGNLGNAYYSLGDFRKAIRYHEKSLEISREIGDKSGESACYGNLGNAYHSLGDVYARKGEPLSSCEVQNMLSSQKRNAVLIEYFTTEEETFIFILSSVDKELHVKTIPLSEERLFQYTENYWREVVDYPDFRDIGQTWIGLSDYLIHPVSELHVLTFNGEPLIKRHPVCYAPSASLLKFCQNKGSHSLKSCASFGAAFEEEAKDVAGLFGSKAYSGPSVSKDTVFKNCTDKDVIHFSCHGYFNGADPLSSGIVLDERIFKAREILPDQVLTAREIFSMRLNTELVTLSACQTGLNERSPGDELIGLTRAFLYAGAPSVLVSLWSVNARSTHELMLEFYRQLKKGADKATALQEAQIEIMEKKEYRHPYYWAPFVLIGDWR